MDFPRHLTVPPLYFAETQEVKVNNDQTAGQRRAFDCAQVNRSGYRASSTYCCRSHVTD